MAGGSSGKSDGENSDSSEDSLCTTTVGADADELSEELFGSNDEDVGPVLKLALDLQSDVLFPLILMATVLLLIGAILFVVTKIMQKKLQDPSSAPGAIKKSKMLKPAALAFIWLAAMIAFGAAVGSSMGISALNFIIPVLATNIRVTGGNVLQALQFIAFILCVVFGITATMLIGDPLEKQQQQLGGENGFNGENDFNVEEKQLGYDGSEMDGQQQQGVMELPDEMPEGMDPEEWAQLQQQQQEQIAAQQAAGEAGAYPEDGQFPQDGGEYPPEGGEYPQDGQYAAEGGEYGEEQYQGGEQPFDEGAQYGGEQDYAGGEGYPDDQGYPDNGQGQPPYPQ